MIVGFIKRFCLICEKNLFSRNGDICSDCEKLKRSLMSQSYRADTFEGRCGECTKPLKLNVDGISRTEIRITIGECPDHPEKGVILIPQRKDVVYSPLEAAEGE